MPKRSMYRKFNGKKYTANQTCEKKSTANVAASTRRRKGGLARVTKESDGYVVWTRSK